MERSVVNVAIVTNSFFGRGGAEVVTQNLARKLIEMGLNVTLFLGETIDLIKSKEFKVVQLPRGTLEIGLKSSIKSKNLKQDLCKRLSDYDAVHFCMFTNLISLAPYFKHPNWFVTCHGTDIQNPRITNYRNIVKLSPFPIKYKGFRTKLINEIYLRLTILFYRNKGHYVSVSDDMVKQLIALGVQKKRTHKIINGLDINRFQKTLSQSIIKNINREEFIIYCVGRNDSRKGFYTLLDAATEFKKRGMKNIRFVIKGQGFQRFIKISKSQAIDQYFTLIDHNFNFKQNFTCDFVKNDDYLPDTQTIAFYKIADIVVIPSYIEALSNVGIEAEAAGKPIIVSDTFGCSEFIRRGTALGFKTGDGVDLVDKILWIRGSATTRQKLDQQRRKNAESICLKHATAKYLELIEKGFVDEVS